MGAFTITAPDCADAFAGRRTPDNIRRSAAVFSAEGAAGSMFASPRSGASVLSTTLNMRAERRAVTGTNVRNNPRTATNDNNDQGDAA